MKCGALHNYWGNPCKGEMLDVKNAAGAVIGRRCSVCSRSEDSAGRAVDADGVAREAARILAEKTVADAVCFGHLDADHADYIVDEIMRDKQ